MEAAYITGPGPAEAIRYGRLPVPAVSPTDALVKVQALAANPVDAFVRSGAFPTAMPAPFVIGRDLLGEVVVGGSGAGFAPGARVWCNSLGHHGRQGSFAQYSVVATDRLYHAPSDIEPLALVAAAHPAASAWLALFRHGRLRYGERICVSGAGGNVGSAVVAFAAAAGAKVVATARPEDHARLRTLGAAEVFDYRAHDLHQHLHDAALGGYDLYLDTSGRDDTAAAIDLLTHGGRLVIMAGLNRAPQLPLGRLYTRDASLIGFAITNATTADLADAAAGVVGLLRTTEWRPRIIQRLPLSQAAHAHSLLESGSFRGRIVLEPDSGHPIGEA
ncbi:zinc-binding dehydrogenase [Streptomyces sp. NPDC101151]|uniref:zinc-binding dehydrogenase n=1 Tax=Streptomyces sp. NPDC101151 TaxID=3366115 RepID=UPI003829CA1D